MKGGLIIAIVLAVVFVTILVGWALANIGAILITFVIGVVVGWLTISYSQFASEQKKSGDQE